MLHQRGQSGDGTCDSLGVPPLPSKASCVTAETMAFSLKPLAWTGSSLVLAWFWTGPVLVWSWPGSGLGLAWFWPGPVLVWSWPGLAWPGSGLVLAWPVILQING